jgi:hypothetical protein
MAAQSLTKSGESFSVVLALPRIVSETIFLTTFDFVINKTHVFPKKNLMEEQTK